MMNPESYSTAFMQALERGDREALRSIPKGEHHNHGLLGSRRERLEAHIGSRIPAPKTRMYSIADLDDYLFGVLAPLLGMEEGFVYGIGAAFQQAVEDHITTFEMSIDAGFLFNISESPLALTRMIKEIHQQLAPEIEFIPQLGLNRASDPGKTLELLKSAIDTGFFRSLDLYGNELARPAEEFKEIYRTAAGAGWKCTAHSGEFGNAESVRHCVETLELSEVQHGIAAAYSEEVMQWLQTHHIRLNVCPTSNVVLSRCEAYHSHPIRSLYDHGIRLSINTDDLMIFGQSVSDEYMNLYECGLMSAAELDRIRLQSF
jgi:adenosine deaminase